MAIFSSRRPVVRRPISANPGLIFNSGLFFLCLKSIFSDNFPYIIFRESIHQIPDQGIKLNLLFKLLYLNSNFALTLGYQLIPRFEQPSQGP